MSIEHTPTRNYATVKQLASEHDWLSESALRWMIFNAEKNGFSECLVRLGRKVLIDTDKFFARVEKGGKLS